MCKAFPLGRAFLALNIVVVSRTPPFHIYNPSKSPQNNIYVVTLVAGGEAVVGDIEVWVIDVNS